MLPKQEYQTSRRDDDAVDAILKNKTIIKSVK